MASEEASEEPEPEVSEMKAKAPLEENATEVADTDTGEVDKGMA
jgi:hypothetical protein